MINTPKRYWLYDLRILFKNSVVFWSILCLSPIIGFLLPKDLYDLLNRGILSNKIPLNFVILGFVVLVLVNIFIIRIFLLTKYAIKRQSIIASPIIYTVVAVLTFGGLWSRLYLEFVTPDASVIFGSTTPVAPHLPLSFWSAAASLSVTFSLFSTAYGLASEPFSKVDYSDFHASMESFMLFMQGVKSLQNKRSPSSLSEKSITEGRKFVGEAVVTLNKVMLTEKGIYSDFVEKSILMPLIDIEEFLTRKDVGGSPEFLFDLFRADDEIYYEWIKKSTYPKSFRSLTYFFRGG